MLFEKLSNKSQTDLIFDTWQSLHLTYESIFGNTHFDEFISAIKDGMNKGDITEEVLNDQRLLHIASDQASPEFPFLYSCVLCILAEQAIDNEDSHRTWPLIVQASASSEAAALHAFYKSHIDSPSELNQRRAYAGAEARKAKFQPAKDYAIKLLKEKQPKNGWSDFTDAANSIKKELTDFIEDQRISLSKDLIVNTLKRWLKDDEDFRKAVDAIINTTTKQ